MKKRTILALFLLVLVTPLANQSCTNLDEEVFDRLTEENFPQTEEEFIAALGAAYTGLYSWGNHGGYFSIQEVSSDEVVIPQRGSDWFDGGIWLRMKQHTFNRNENYFNGAWTFCFSGVATCNRLIELFTTLVEDGKVEASFADPFIAELRTIRALYYFWLLDSYGKVPIVTKFADAEREPASNSRQEVFNFVESELAASVPLLVDAKDGSTYARFNRAAGLFLQAKLYLNAQVYTGTAKNAEALAACDAIINSGDYTLESNYFDNFKTENAGSRENIFVVPYDQVNARGFNLPQMTLHYGSQSTFNLQQQPWNGYCTMQEFYNSYEDTDLRKNGPTGRGYGNFIAGPQFTADGATRILDANAEAADPDGQPLTFTPEINELAPGALRQAGARIGKFEFAVGATPDLDNDFPLMRYADVLLMKAEALMRLGRAGEGLPIVNQIRARAGVADFTELNETNLLAERGREMFYEGWRRQDLIRFGKFNDPWDFKGASEPFRTVFPIPQDQINANPKLEQNPGY
ncbi:MAG: RagB/SusD family nutrient uptake outer membrane protein [Bacteroidia bacterium]|nr:RagB/SusD family nutrient uptake outer membrane protein [Bacteroidia bacterium]